MTSRQWSPRASPPQLSELSPLASGGEDDFARHATPTASPGCTVVLNPLPSELLESLSSDGHVRMGLPTPPDSVRGDDAAEQDTVSELLRDMVDRLDRRRKKKKKHHHHHRRRHQTDEAPPAPQPSVCPIFVWARQAEEGVIGEVWCEDYDKRNRLRLTKTPGGWRAIPRTRTLSELEAAAQPPKQRPDSACSSLDEHQDGAQLEDKVDDKVVAPEEPVENPAEDPEGPSDPAEEPCAESEAHAQVSEAAMECPALDAVKQEAPEEVVLQQPPPEEVADLSAKKREPGPLPCRSPLLRLPPLPRKPLPSPVLQQPPCDFRTPSPAHQAQPLALPGVPRTLSASPLPAHLPKRPALDTPPEPPAKKLRATPEPTLRELLREKKQESRLMELLTTTPKRAPPPPPPQLDALTQLRLVTAQLRVPDPLLIPQSRLSALLASPATEIPRLMAMPPSPLSPDLIPVALDKLQALLQRPDTELLAWAAQDWALPPVMHYPFLHAWHTPPPPPKPLHSPRVAAPSKHPPPPAPAKPRIACKALSDLMPKKKPPAPKPSPQLVSPPPDFATSLQGATKNLPQLWHPLFGSHTSDSWNWRKTVPVHGD